MTLIGFPETLKELLLNKVINPIFDSSAVYSADWNNIVTSKIVDKNTFDAVTKSNHRNKVLENGQVDFTKSQSGLTTNELVLLYTFYYFQMHFSSSTLFFYSYRKFIVDSFLKDTNRLIFLDIGCGPYTTGLAFLHFTRLASIKEVFDKLQIEYYGIDNSSSMHDLGKDILIEYQNTINDNGFKYSVISNDNSYQNINEIVNNCDSQTTILINCCYFFASQSINIIEFVNVIQELIDQNPKSKITLFYQNARNNSNDVTQNYITFKKLIKGLSEGINIKPLSFSFDDQFKSCNRKTLEREVNVQVLKNF